MSTKVTEEQAARAVDLVRQLANAARKGGLAAELRIGRPFINEIVWLQEEIEETNRGNN